MRSVWFLRGFEQFSRQVKESQMFPVMSIRSERAQASMVGVRGLCALRLKGGGVNDGDDIRTMSM